jgi:hypothetical protein
MRTVNLIVLVVVGLLLFVALVAAIVTAIGSNDPEDVGQAQFALPWIAEVLGVFFIVVGTVGLLASGLLDAAASRTAALAGVVLAGALLIEAHWSAALGLAAIAVAGLAGRAWAVRA